MIFSIILIITLLTLITWAKLYPDKKITIQARNINNFRESFFKVGKDWANNRIQERRIAKNLVQHDQLFGYMPNDDLEKAFARTRVINFKGKKSIIIPTKTYEMSNLAKEQLESNSATMLTKYYPNCHWKPARLKRIKYTNYYITIISEK